MASPHHDSSSTPARQAGGPIRLIVAVLVLALGVALIALLVFGRYGN